MSVGVFLGHLIALYRLVEPREYLGANKCWSEDLVFDGYRGLDVSMRRAASGPIAYLVMHHRSPHSAKGARIAAVRPSARAPVARAEAGRDGILDSRLRHRVIMLVPKDAPLPLPIMPIRAGRGPADQALSGPLESRFRP